MGLNFNVNCTHLPVISTSGYGLTVRTVCQSIHVEEVALLLEDIGLRLPLPHQQLTQATAPKRQPLSVLFTATLDILCREMLGGEREGGREGGGKRESCIKEK